MPTLPTLTINDTEVWTRLLAAFDNDPEKYKMWLKGSLQNYVKIQEELELAAQTEPVENLLDGVN